MRRTKTFGLATALGLLLSCASGSKGSPDEDVVHAGEPVDTSTVAEDNGTEAEMRDMDDGAHLVGDQRQDEPIEDIEVDDGNPAKAGLFGPCDATAECAIGLRCDTDSGRCVQCQSDSDCEYDQFCDYGRCQAWVCVPGTRWCEGAVAKTCSERGDGVSEQVDCDDQDPCTQGDGCVNGECLEGVPVDCDDQDPCTSDICDEGECVHEPVDAPCDDGNPCTNGDTCQDGACVGGAPTDCDDENPCTADTCSPEFGCVHMPVEGPCDDQDPCTSGDECWLGACVGQQDPCDDQDPCTLDTCDESTGVCDHEPAKECAPCSSDQDCRDGNACTSDACVDGDCLHGPADGWPCCSEASDCVPSGPCVQVACDGFTCTYEILDTPECCEHQVYHEDFADGAAGFEFSPATDGVGWQVVSTEKGFDTGFALYYGNPEAKNYDSGGRNFGQATSPPIVVPQHGAISLTFHTYLDVEKGAGHDVLVVSALGTTGELELWRKQLDTPQKTLVEVDQDISLLAGKVVRLKFSFDTVDAVANGGEGVYVGEIFVKSTCEAPGCDNGLDCHVLGIPFQCKSGHCDFHTGLVGFATMGESVLKEPYDCVWQDGMEELLVSDRGLGQVVVFNQAGDVARVIGKAGKNPGELMNPHGLFVDGDELYVADTANDRIQVFSLAGTFLYAFGKEGSGPGRFNDPKDVAIDPLGRILVADTSNHRVQVFDSDWVYLFDVGQYGKEPGQFRSPSCVVPLDQDGRFVVCDVQNNRLQILEPDGSVAAVVKTPGGLHLHHPYALFATGQSWIVADSYNDRLLFLDPQDYQVTNALWPEEAGLKFPVGLATSSQGWIFVVEGGPGRVSVLAWQPPPP